jgi:hypothetical protein
MSDLWKDCYDPSLSPREQNVRAEVSPAPLLILREMAVACPDGEAHLHRQWYLFAGDVVIAHIPSFKDFVNGWMNSDPMHFAVEPLGRLDA